eukprot:m.301607 g.301607  ORF g.301607 m.301607 type:complete len:481 (+) comp16427_c0_seq4:463-1905(+)
MSSAGWPSRADVTGGRPSTSRRYATPQQSQSQSVIERTPRGTISAQVIARPHGRSAGNSSSYDSYRGNSEYMMPVSDANWKNSGQSRAQPRLSTRSNSNPDIGPAGLMRSPPTQEPLGRPDVVNMIGGGLKGHGPSGRLGNPSQRGHRRRNSGNMDFRPAQMSSQSENREKIYAWQLLRGTTEADYPMILRERKEYLLSVDLAESEALIAEWNALIAELDAVARNALGVDAKGYKAQYSGYDKKKGRKRSNSFLARDNAKLVSPENTNEIKGRERSHTLSSFFGINVLRKAPSLKSLKAPTPQVSKIRSEQNILTTAVELHKAQMREKAQREARARADAENAAWKAALAEAEARAAEEELAKVPSLEVIQRNVEVNETEEVRKTPTNVEVLSDDDHKSIFDIDSPPKIMMDAESYHKRNNPSQTNDNSHNQRQTVTPQSLRERIPDDDILRTMYRIAEDILNSKKTTQLQEPQPVQRTTV